MFVERVRRRAAMAGVLTLALVLASCGAVESALGDDEADGTEEETATSTTDPPVFDPDAYCSLSHEADQINAAFSAFDDPVQLEGFITSLTGLLGRAVPPPGVEAEFVTFRTAYVDLQAQLQAGAYSIEVLQASPILSDANVNAAIEAVDAHDLALCGVAPGLEAPVEEAAPESEEVESESAPNPFTEALASGDFSAVEAVLRSETGRETFIESFVSASPRLTPEQAGCFLDNSDIQVLAEMSVDPDNLSPEAVEGFLAALDACGIQLSDFQTE